VGQYLLDKGREGFGNGTLSSANTWKARLINLATASNISKAITALTGAASPITVTVASTAGWANGNTVLVSGVTGNTSANGLFRIANLTGTTFDLQTIPGPGQSQLATTGNGVATVTSAFVMNLSLASASTDLIAAAGSSTDQTLASVTITNGVFNCTSPVAWSANVAASTLISALAIYQSAPTDRVAFVSDGKIPIRVVTAASGGATALAIEPIYATIPNGTAIPLSNGVTATLTSQANAGATALAVSALGGSVAVGHTGDATISGFNLPATTGSPGLQTVSVAVDATNGWFKI
jgi:hypothetical protein